MKNTDNKRFAWPSIRRRRELLSMMAWIDRATLFYSAPDVADHTLADGRRRLTMDQARQRIQDDLRGLVRGDVRCDDLFVQLYASDASIYQIKPLGVVRPRSTADVAACVQYASEQRIPMHARGAGTGLAGESLGGGLVIDFSRYMRRVLRTDPDHVRVQPGVVLAKLNEHLLPFGRIFGPDPAMSQVTTMGSVIAIDASGSHWLQYGSARRHVESLEVVLSDGTVMEARPRTAHALRRRGARFTQAGAGRQVAELLRQNAELIARRQPRTLVNQCGYQLSDVLGDAHLDMGRLLSGSEGTLAIITEATVSTHALPRFSGVGLLFFEFARCGDGGRAGNSAVCAVRL